ncbi:hypothetical protein VTJ83DRAFT_5535 [Remersonia thermophila]|uniref:YTH domain-containing protein n=1 Tax=Remersonia thermophila TaxID=72144 RepID=A0ABR4D741_9PEZI
MASRLPPQKINLDARAAELREKLYRARQNAQRLQASQGQPSAQAAQPVQDNTIAGGASFAAAASASASPAAMASQPTPSATSQDKPQACSLVNDIAALIHSISSGVPDSPTQESAERSGSSPVPSTAPAEPATAPEQPATPSDPKPALNDRASIDAAPVAPSDGLAVTATGFPYPTPTMIVTTHEPANPATTPGPDPPTATSDMKNAGKPAINLLPMTGRSSLGLSNRDQRPRARIILPIVVASIAPKAPTMNGPRENPLTDLSSRDTLQRLLSMDPELKDFLEMTDYFNAETRARRLDRFRRAKELAEQKRKIEEEERRLREEEELEMNSYRSSTATRLPSTLSTSAISEAATLPTPVTPLLQNAAMEFRDTSGVSPGTLKRHINEEGAGERLEKVPRINTPIRARSVETRSGDGERQILLTRPRHDAHTDRDEARDDRREPRRRSVSPAERYRFRQAGDDRRGSFSYKGGNRYVETDRRSLYPIPVDLGSKGETRFFIVKSFNEVNVRRCMEDGLWTTQVQNEKILSDAFVQCKNVILFFSINKSKAFQGYARMTSAPSPDTPKPSFAKNIHWDTSDAFRVEWLSKTSVDFWRVGHLKNALNDNEPVLVGKDGQEIEPECGADLLRIMESVAIERERGADKDGDRHRHERGGHGAGYGGHYYRHQYGQKRGGFHHNRW